MKKATTFLAVFLVALSSLSALDFESYGLSVIGERVEEGVTFTRLRDQAGRQFVFAAEVPVGPSEVAVIQQVVDRLYGFSSMEIEELRIVVGERRVSVQVLPREFRHDGIDLGALVPAGIQFYFFDYLEYDFRMLVRGLFLRLRGQFVNEELLLDRLVGAARNPEQFLQSQNPEFILSRIHELETRSFELEQDLARTQDELAATQSALQSVSLERDRVEQELELTRNAVLVFENRGFFGSLRIPQARAVARLLELKEEVPGLRQDAMRDRLNAEGFSLSKKEVFLIYSLYFNEFE